MLDEQDLRIDIDTMHDPLRLPVGRYIAHRWMLVGSMFGEPVKMLQPGDTFTVPEGEILIYD